MHELAYGITSNNEAFGAVGNPYAPTTFAGGSSGGTAAAVSGRLVPAGLGTDTGGSVRIPAGLTGIFGFRPSIDRYPKGGITPISTTRDTAGPMARTVADLILLDAVITGGDHELAAKDLSGLRFGVPRRFFYDNLDGETATVIEAALTKLQAAGAVLIEVDMADFSAPLAGSSTPIAMSEFFQELPEYLKRTEPPVDFDDLVAQVASPDVQGIINGTIAEGGIPAEVYRDAITVHRPALQQIYADYFKEHQVVGILFPTTLLPARPIAGSHDTVELNGEQVPTFRSYARNTDPGSTAGIPGLSVPVGLTGGGLPVGLELDGPAGSDRDVLAVGLALEKLYFGSTLPVPD